jgi:acyl-coenzyme A thioesterase PaaI-like protein
MFAPAIAQAWTLLDSACGCAVHPRLIASQVYATLALKALKMGPIRATML